MSQTTSINVKSLADLIEADIRHRGLRSGDPYLSASEAAKHFGVSTRAANSALQLLAQRRIVKRRQRLGSLVTLSYHQSLPDSQLDVVHLLVNESYLKKEGLLADGVVVGIQGVMPKADIQFNFMPQSDETEYVNATIHAALKSQRREGFVVVRSSIETQRAVGRSGLPSVVHGTTCPSVENVSSIDRDRQQDARLAANHFAAAGCKNLLLLMRDHVFPGDHLFFDSLRSEIRQLGIPGDAVIYRFMPSDELVVEREIQRLSDTIFKDRCGIYCHTPIMADGAVQVVHSLNLPEQRRPQILIGSYYKTTKSPPTLPYLYPKVSPQEIGRHIGILLIEQASARPTPRHEHYPVELIMPQSKS